VKKIAVCGKGGSGKSTVVTLLADQLCSRGIQVLVVDADESNAGSYRMLGFEQPPVPLLVLAGGKKNVRRHMLANAPSDRDKAPVSVLSQNEIRLKDIPPGYVMQRNGLRLAAIGKIHQALEGCACPMGVLCREFLKRLRLEGDEMAIVDMEAGVEHFGRGIETSIDKVLAVVEPSLESILLAARVQKLANGAGARFTGVVLNKVPDSDTRLRLALELGKHQLPILGVIEQHQEITEAGLAGRMPPSADLADEIGPIVDALVTTNAETIQ